MPSTLPILAAAAAENPEEGSGEGSEEESEEAGQPSVTLKDAVETCKNAKGRACPLSADDVLCFLLELSVKRGGAPKNAVRIYKKRRLPEEEVLRQLKLIVRDAEKSGRKQYITRDKESAVETAISVFEERVR